MKKILIVVLAVCFCLLAFSPALATDTVTAGYGCTRVDETTVAVAAGSFFDGSTGMVVNILGYTPGTETFITMTVSYLDPDIAESTFIPMGDDNATSGYISAYKKTWRASFLESGIFVPVEKEWRTVRLTFALVGGSGGVFTVGVRKIRD